ncbi:hypothetical protein [Floridanema evergladense]|uniref:Uncharacterized protein n=1 Tax=Floridaenema evergladense BLCC-F167 TaxID=3153639 RepID=A0ABV4WRG2_9CYAN
MQSPSSLNQSTFTISAKSIFASKTFWGATFTALAAIAPIVGTAVEKHKLTVDETVKIAVILFGTGATVAGRVQAKDSVYTPDCLPGPNKSDVEPSQS